MKTKPFTSGSEQLALTETAESLFNVSKYLKMAAREADQSEEGNTPAVLSLIGSAREYLDQLEEAVSLHAQLTKPTSAPITSSNELLEAIENLDNSTDITPDVSSVEFNSMASAIIDAGSITSLDPPNWVDNQKAEQAWDVYRNGLSKVFDQTAAQVPAQTLYLSFRAALRRLGIPYKGYTPVSSKPLEGDSKLTDAIVKLIKKKYK